MLKFTDTETTDTMHAIAVPAIESPETLQSSTLTSEEQRLLASKFASNRPLDQEWANGRLQSLDVTALIALMAEQRKAQKERLKLVCGVYAAVTIVMSCLAATLRSPYFVTSWIPFSSILIVAVAAYSKLQKSGAAALARFDDVRAVGELVASLEIRDQEVLNAVRAALTRILPRLSASDAHLLDTRQRTILRKYMDGAIFGRFEKAPNSEDLTVIRLMILKALEQVGDASFEPVIARWATGESYGADMRIRDAAQECLVSLKLQVGRSQAERELMRPSTAETGDGAQTLVRPAGSAAIPDTDPQQLLRPDSRH